MFAVFGRIEVRTSTETAVMIFGYVLSAIVAFIAAKRDFRSVSGDGEISWKRIAIMVLALIVLVTALILYASKLDFTENSSVNDASVSPVIFSIVPDRGPVGTVVTLRGKGLSGFEGDLELIFERKDGKKVSLFDEESYSKTGGEVIIVKVKEPCQAGEMVYGRYSGNSSQCDYVEFTPGVYKVYSSPWGMSTNVVSFTVTK